MQPHTPFTRPLRDLEVGDLKALKEASEGWYIEYKREPTYPTPAASQRHRRRRQ